MAMYVFRWNEWNIEHIAKHGVSPWEAEETVRRARRPYPRTQGEGKWLVRGQTAAGRYLQVVFLLEEDGTAYVIHARPLRDGEKKSIRGRR